MQYYNAIQFAEPLCAIETVRKGITWSFPRIKRVYETENVIFKETTTHQVTSQLDIRERVWPEKVELTSFHFRNVVSHLACLYTRLYVLGWPISPIQIVTPYKVAEVSITMLNMKGFVIYLIHITTAVKFTIVPDLRQTDVGIHHHK